MIKNLKEKYGKKLFVLIIIIMVLASFGAGFIIEKIYNRNNITESSSFFDRNQKEIAEGFMNKIMSEYDDMMELKSVSYKKGEIHLFIDTKGHEFDEMEYILTEDNIQVIYISNIETDENIYKQLIKGELNYD